MTGRLPVALQPAVITETVPPIPDLYSRSRCIILTTISDGRIRERVILLWNLGIRMLTADP